MTDRRSQRDADAALLERLGAAMSSPAVEPSVAEIAALRDAVADHWATLPEDGRNRRRRGWRRPWSVVAGLFGALVVGGGVAFASGAPLPQPVRSVARDIGLPVTTPAVAGARQGTATLHADLADPVVSSSTTASDAGALATTPLNRLHPAQRSQVGGHPEQLLQRACDEVGAAVGGRARSAYDGCASLAGSSTSVSSVTSSGRSTRGGDPPGVTGGAGGSRLVRTTGVGTRSRHGLLVGGAVLGTVVDWLSTTGNSSDQESGGQVSSASSDDEQPTDPGAGTATRTVRSPDPDGAGDGAASSSVRSPGTGGAGGSSAATGSPDPTSSDGSQVVVPSSVPTAGKATGAGRAWDLVGTGAVDPAIAPRPVDPPVSDQPVSDPPASDGASDGTPGRVESSGALSGASTDLVDPASPSPTTGSTRTGADDSSGGQGATETLDLGSSAPSPSAPR